MFLRQDSTSTETNTNTRSTKTQDLVLSNLGGVELAAYNSQTKHAGDIQFTTDVLISDIQVETPVILFGQNLPKHQASEPQRINPNLEIHGLSEQIKVIAAIDGVVGFVKQQPGSDDAEVFLQPEKNSDWTIGYDHVVDVQVTQGQQVRVGDVLGKAALDDRFGYYYEFQINQDNTANGTIMHCPTALLTNDIKATQQAAFDQLVSDWEQWYKKDVFPTQSGGCVRTTITAAESEGRL